MPGNSSTNPLGLTEPYVKNVCIYRTTSNGYPSARMDVFVDVPSLGIGPLSGWNNALVSKFFRAETSGIISVGCAQGGGSPYGAYFC